MSKRSNISDDDEDVQSSSHKRARASEADQQVTAYQSTSQALTTTVNLRNASLILSDKASRTSSLAAPEMYLSGHEGAVYSLSFDPSGQHLCSASMDKTICKSLLHSFSSPLFMYFCV